MTPPAAPARDARAAELAFFVSLLLLASGLPLPAAASGIATVVLLLGESP